MPGAVKHWFRKQRNRRARVTPGDDRFAGVPPIPAPDPSRLVYGGIVSRTPLVALGKRERRFGNPFGFLTLAPQIFRGQSSVLFVSLAWSHESTPMVRNLAADLKTVGPQFPLCRIVMLANTSTEYRLFKEAGIDVILASELLFTDDRLYQVSDPVPEKRYDAIYVGRLDQDKRHELATSIQRLLLLYKDPGPENLRKYRSLLPNATFGNHDLDGGGYRNYVPPQYNEIIQRAHVGICLSELEGAMRASIEYALCGLPVVSTLSLGGRDRFLNRRYARIVPTIPEQINFAVRDFVAARPNPHDVRRETMNMIDTGRTQFVDEANAVFLDVFGGGFRVESFDRFRDAFGQVMRPLSDILKTVDA